MARVVSALTQGIALEGLAEYYEDLGPTFVPTGTPSTTYRPGTVGARRVELKPRIYEAVTRCSKLAQELVAAHAELVGLLREWRRLG